MKKLEEPGRSDSPAAARLGGAAGLSPLLASFQQSPECARPGRRGAATGKRVAAGALLSGPAAKAPPRTTRSVHLELFHLRGELVSHLANAGLRPGPRTLAALHRHI